MPSVRRATNFIVIHCSATRPSQDIGRDEIDAWHRARGWTGIGYHCVIRRDGSAEMGRAWDTVGAHVEGHNADSVGLCLVGGLDAHGQPAPDYTDRQWDALWALVQAMRLTYPEAEVRGHRDFPGVTKACPSFDVRAWLAEREAMMP
jgi:N-acetyl-anhydromuramyl-L-alanine amidase AmpD